MKSLVIALFVAGLGIGAASGPQPSTTDTPRPSAANSTAAGAVLEPAGTLVLARLQTHSPRNEGATAWRENAVT